MRDSAPGGRGAAQCASACPGVAEGFGACTGRGACDDGFEGGGTCDCADGFEGARCGGAVAGEIVERTAPALPSARGTPADFALEPGQRWGGAVAVVGGTGGTGAPELAVGPSRHPPIKEEYSYCGLGQISMPPLTDDIWISLNRFPQ